MNNIDELLLQSVQELRKQKIEKTTFHKPQRPACILYLGKQTALYHKELKADIANGWGNSAKHTLYYVVNSPDDLDFTAINDDGTAAGEITVDSVCSNIQNMLELSSVFVEKSPIALYCIIETSVAKTPEEFEKWYCSINIIKNKLFNDLAVSSMFMMIFKERIGEVNNISNDIRGKLLSLYKNGVDGKKNEHIYDSVFIFSNKLKDNSFVCIDPEKLDYIEFNLFADVVLLTNSDLVNQRDIMKLFDKRKPAITAAYGYVQKPMRDIALVTYKTIVEKVAEKVKNETIGASALADALEITVGKFVLSDKIYQDIKPHLPSNNFIGLLPGKISEGMLFKDCNEKSFGCLQAFVNENHIKVIESIMQQQKSKLIESVIDLLNRKLNVAAISEGILANTISEVLKTAETGNIVEIKCLHTDAAIEALIKKTILVNLRDIVQEAINLAVEKSKECYDHFLSIFNIINAENCISDTLALGNLEGVYTEKVRNYLYSTENLSKIYNSIFSIKNGISDIYDVLCMVASECFESDNYYKMSYFDELTYRIGQTESGMKVQEIIDAELTKNNIQDRIGLRSLSNFSERMLEAYFMNINSDENNGNVLVDHLNQKYIPNGSARVFFSTGRNDKIESVWFYSCNEENLQV